ncbi:MAG: glucosaminidase domain-containing protein [Bacteroidales bacterium]|nr:glucosaminidase domain-containing protein [Bacteroidales bacterium]
MVKKLISLLSLLLPAAVLLAQTPQEKYIDTYSQVAVEEMLRSGVPASITLAQGLLESGSGQSRLATEGNNHFGIKCHKGWTGRSMKHDDDARNECFRVYDSPEQSFRDHSDFLRYRDRYKFLFDLERTDYQGWAYGLKQAGYATDPKYAGKLIKYIEDYNLSRFDIVSVEEEAALPEAPHKIEEPVAVSSVRSAAPGEDPVQPREDFHFPLTRALYSLNGVPFVYAMEGESYGSLAKYYHLFKWEILRYNDVSKDTVLDAGTVVYLQSKKNQAPEGLEKYIVSEDGEDFHTICQRFGVKEKAILKLNGLEAPVQLLEGDEIKLR